jgi:hypothetical protein
VAHRRADATGFKAALAQTFTMKTVRGRPVQTTAAICAGHMGVVVV